MSFLLTHGNLYEHTWIDLAKKITGEELRFIKKCLHILHSWRVHTLEYVRCLPPLRIPIKHFTDSTALLSSSCLALWPASQSKPVLDKAAVKRGKSRRGRSWVKRSLYRQSKILNCSVYSALWLGGLRCQYRRQTNGPLAALCPCMMAKIKKTFCRPPGKMPGMPDYQSSPV